MNDKFLATSALTLGKVFQMLFGEELKDLEMDSAGSGPWYVVGFVVNGPKLPAVLSQRGSWLILRWMLGI